MGQPTQRATNYTARSNIVTAQIFLHAKRPTAKARLEQAALAASAGAGSHTPSTASESFSHPPTLPCKKKMTKVTATPTSHLQLEKVFSRTPLCIINRL